MKTIPEIITEIRDRYEGYLFPAGVEMPTELRLVLEVERAYRKLSLFERQQAAVAVDLTKREWFAGIAMQGLLASDDGQTTAWAVTAAIAVAMADAMLAAIAKPKVELEP